MSEYFKGSLRKWPEARRLDEKRQYFTLELVWREWSPEYTIRNANTASAKCSSRRAHQDFGWWHAQRMVSFLDKERRRYLGPLTSRGGGYRRRDRPRLARNSSLCTHSARSRGRGMLFVPPPPPPLVLTLKLQAHPLHRRGTYSFSHPHLCTLTGALYEAFNDNFFLISEITVGFANISFRLKVNLKECLLSCRFFPRVESQV